MTEIDRDVAVEFDKRVNLALRYLFTAATELKDRIDPEHFRVYAKALDTPPENLTWACSNRFTALIRT